MSSRWVALLVSGLLLSSLGAQDLASDKEKQSYAAGVDMGKALRRQGAELDIQALLQGLRDAYASGGLKLTEKELQAALNALQTEIKLQRARPLQMVANRNRSEGEAFLARNQGEAGVVALASGVQYKVLAEGKGPLPSEGDVVSCNYRGLLLDGTEFDNTLRRGEPASLGLKQTVPGLREALQRMPVGSKWQIWIPYALAYGEKGALPRIQPYATLCFELELLGIRN